MKINNLPDYATEYKFIVYRVVDGEKWFYGAYNDYGRAMYVAGTIGGKVA